MLNREDIDDLEHAYLELHYLLGIFAMIIDSKVSGYENSDICCLYNIIMAKRDNFYGHFNSFLDFSLKSS